MANIFCNDGGSNTAPHETWAKAATTFLVAVDAASAGDDIIIGADHAEDPGADVLYTFPGTAASPNRVISSTVGAASVILYNKADNVQIDNSGGQRDISVGGFVQFYGISMKVGDDFNTISQQNVLLEDCIIELARVNNAQLQMGNSNGECNIVFKNTDINFSGGGASSNFGIGNTGNMTWNGGTLSWSGTQPTALFNGASRTFRVNCAGVDFSSISSSLLDVSDSAQISLELHHCLLNSSVSLTTGTILVSATRALMSGCDDTTGNDLYRIEYVDYWGSTVHDDVIFRDDGASDGTTNISWKMVSTANALEFSEPTKSPPIYAWVDITGSTTFTVNMNWDSASDIQDDEAWLEIEFLEASADPDSAFSSDRVADITTSPADQTNNSEAWTGTSGFTNENQQELAVTVTVNRVGPVIARVCLAKPSTTIYVDPLVVKS